MPPCANVPYLVYLLLSLLSNPSQAVRAGVINHIATKYKCGRYWLEQAGVK